MASESHNKNEDATQVLIGGKIYALSGAEPERIHQISTLLNKKISELKDIEGFGRMDPVYKDLMLNINLADEYFKIANELDNLKKELDSKENELYTARHDLVSLKLKLENAIKQEEILEKRVSEWKEKYNELEIRFDDMKERKN